MAVTHCLRIFFAAFCQMSSMAVWGSDDKYKWTETLGADNRCWVSVLGYLVSRFGAVTWMKCARKLKAREVKRMPLSSPRGGVAGLSLETPRRLGCAESRQRRMEWIAQQDETRQPI